MSPAAHPGGVVRVAGPGLIPQGLIVPGPGVPVFQNQADGVAGGEALIDAAENMEPVRLMPGGGQRAARSTGRPGAAPVTSTPTAGPWDSPKMV